MSDQQMARRQLRWFETVSLVMAALYAIFYFLHPLLNQAREIILYSIYMICVASPAVVASMVLNSYESTDAPIRIWRYFTYGFWAWTVAEFIWVLYNVFQGSAPLLNLADPFYVIGYIWMTLAVADQIRLTGPQRRVLQWQVVVPMWTFMLIAGGVAFFLTTSFRVHDVSLRFYIGSFLNSLYGIGDLTLAATAVLLLTIFGSGALGKPWWGFIILGLADVFYGWLTQVGTHQFRILSGEILYLLSDLTYLLAYLVIAYSFLRQYVLLRFGPFEAPAKPEG